MSEDHNVSQVGDYFGRQSHREVKVKRCVNGYVVNYKIVREDKGFIGASAMITEERVFITNTDMLEFLEKYFAGEPKP